MIIYDRCTFCQFLYLVSWSFLVATKIWHVNVHILFLFCDLFILLVFGSPFMWLLVDFQVNVWPGVLLQLITDVNIAVAVEVIQAIGNLARGLRTHFSAGSRFLLPVLLVSSVSLHLSMFHVKSWIIVFCLPMFLCSNRFCLPCSNKTATHVEAFHI